MNLSRARTLLPVTALTVTAALLFPTARFAQAAAPDPIIPVTLYPAHAAVTSVPVVSNGQMDCEWGFVCQQGQPLTQQPLFHLNTQDDLHRLSGWAQFGKSRLHEQQMLFALFGSRYSPDDSQGMPWNVHAFSDFRGALLEEGYRDADRVPRLAPQDVVANDSLQELRTRGMDILAMACWTGSIEVEGVVIFQHGSRATHRVALRSLTLQMRAAVLATG